MDLHGLQAIAAELRQTVFQTLCKTGGGHIGPSLSIIEILTTLYFGGVLKYDPRNPQDPRRDRFILSKGHASLALYAALAKAGFIDAEELDEYCRPGSRLGGHPNMHEVPGVEASTGALAHGLSFAVGAALAAKLDGTDNRVIALLGDGECQEGAIWEAAMFSAHQRLGQLTAIVDNNKLQAMDRLDNIIAMDPFADKWRAFGWEVLEVDGHDIPALLDALDRAKIDKDGAPKLIVAHTVKGKGISFMEGVPLWHVRMPNEEERTIAAQELALDRKGAL
ncbi:transketolase [Heliobacterium gestii]|uniref:Transketolase n=1 Tax=Heliomicrobium gestii TaxID=2699 RepID=A0A845LBT3_HELGE|nr:transketolase [Heliomicrobium gestii]